MKKITALVLCVSLLMLSGCNSKSEPINTVNDTDGVKDNVMQEQDDISRNHTEKISNAVVCSEDTEFVENIGFTKGGITHANVDYNDDGTVSFDNTTYNNEDESYDAYQGYSYKNVLPYAINVDNYIFYISEDMDLHIVNSANNTDKIIAKISGNVIYSDSYMIFYGSTDGYNSSHYLYDIKNEKTTNNEVINSSYCVGLCENNLCYFDEENGLKYQNLADNSITNIYTSTDNKNDDTAEWFAGLCAIDSQNNCIYYGVNYTYYDNDNDGRVNGYKLFRYDFTDKSNREVYTDALQNYATNEFKNSPPFSELYAVNGSLYTFKYNSEIGVFKLENNEVKKLNDFPAGSDHCLIDNLIYYKSNDKNIIINNDDMLAIDSILDNESGFLGIFNDSYWYSTSKYLKTLNTENNELEEKVLFNGFIINADGDTLYCYGKPIEKHEVTDVYGSKSTSFEEGADAIYKVSINDIETEQKFRDVFFVSDDNKSKAFDILGEKFGNELNLLVKLSGVSAKDTTYDEKYVSVIVSGTFRILKDTWIDGNVVFSVNISDNTCYASGGSISWETVLTSYKMGN